MPHGQESAVQPDIKCTHGGLCFICQHGVDMNEITPVLPCNGFSACLPSRKVQDKFPVSPWIRRVQKHHSLSFVGRYCVTAVVLLHQRGLPLHCDARLTHQGLYLQLLHCIMFTQCESASESSEQEQKNAGLHCEVLERSCRPVTSVKAASTHTAASNSERERRGETSCTAGSVDCCYE